MFEWRTWETGAAQFHTRLRFPGQYHDAETDLYENWNRYYEPTTGRYLSPEPLVGPTAWSENYQVGGWYAAYTYASANPAAFSDPDGNQSTLDLLPPMKGDKTGKAIKFEYTKEQQRCMDRCDKEKKAEAAKACTTPNMKHYAQECAMNVSKDIIRCKANCLPDSKPDLPSSEMPLRGKIRSFR